MQRASSADTFSLRIEVGPLKKFGIRIAMRGKKDGISSYKNPITRLNICHNGIKDVPLILSQGNFLPTELLSKSKVSLFPY